MERRFSISQIEREGSDACFQKSMRFNTSSELQKRALKSITIQEHIYVASALLKESISSFSEIQGIEAAHEIRLPIDVKSSLVDI